MHPLREIGLYLLLIVTFLCSAKTHGRQHRLERELRGYWNVSFTSRSQNDAWVNNFWFRQRLAYWSIASIAALTLLFLRSKIRRFGWKFYSVQQGGISAWILFLLLAALIAMILAFTLTGLWSTARLALTLRVIQPPGIDWLHEVIKGSAGWWSFTLTLIVSSVLYAKNLLFSASQSRV